MSIPSGTIEYQLGKVSLTGSGISFSASELDTAMKNDVVDILFDSSGKLELETLLTSVVETDFDKQQIERILSNKRPPENWRVGEALAEAYLVTQKDCFFPWPDGRDERKTGSSLPGADLVGFHNSAGSYCFAFGEVKTSSDNNTPPQAMFGRTGLKKQIEDLKDDVKIKDDLVRYLGFRATNSTWKLQYQNAAKRYVKSNNDIYVYGVLIRDIAPNINDLSTRIEKLKEKIYDDMVIQLYAIYLPFDTIRDLSEKAINIRNGDEE